MKQGIHPKYEPTTIKCVCGNVIETRSTKKELLAIADELESQYQARICAAHVREAAEVYERRGRLRRES